MRLSLTKFYLLLITLTVALAGCSTTPPVTVKTGYDHGTQFGHYHTFAVDRDPIGLSPTGESALQEALHSSLSARGFQEASAKTADLYIISRVFTQEKLHSMPSANTTYLPSRYGRYGGTWLINTDVTQYSEGSLVIDFVDRKTHKLVFRGLGQAAIGMKERNAAAIREAVNQIVAAFPAGKS